MRRQMAALVLVPLGAGLVWINSATGNVISLPPIMGASGQIIPASVPRSRPAPVTLRVGFTSRSTETSAVPELSEIAFEISRHVSWQTAGLPGCSLPELSSSPAEARERCSRSLVGHGKVSSEITVPGQAPVQVTGKLLAFYSLARGRPHILAKVTTGAPLPLTYAIPFTIAKATDGDGTRLFVPEARMRVIAGQCVPQHPYCFSNPYTLKGVYSHISAFEMSLHRVYRHRGERRSFVSATCPAPGVSFPLLKVNLQYADGDALFGDVYRSCEVSK